MAERNTYAMSINLSILDHLGVGLYSNIPAVLSEAVANAWDADAEHVKITIDKDKKEILIEDDGHGMSVADANKKYLQIGYKRRNETGETTARLKRAVMGRKGIGKLSLFSIADTITVHSIKEGKPHGFIMDVNKIRNKIAEGRATYNPNPADSEGINLEQGTRIILSNLKRKIHKSQALRRRLARRFSIIGETNKFEVILDETPISVKDRDYYEKLQYIWTFGKKGEKIAALIPGVKKFKRSPGLRINGHPEKIDGWIGTTVKAGDTKDSKSNDNINKIVIIVRGKLAQEDILSEYGEGGFYSKYIIGEIQADFLDQKGMDDIATTNRQRIIEEDPRYSKLKDKIKKEIKHIQEEWSKGRNEEGVETAFTFPGIKQWYSKLSYDHRTAAKKLFGKINQLPMEDDGDKRRLFVSGVLAFESLKYRHLITKLDNIGVENLDVLEQVFLQLDDLEANAYYQITKDRLAIIKKLENLADDDAKEKVIQKYLFKHLWLLEPSWNWIPDTEHMESTVKKALDGVYEKLTPEQQRARLDITYATTDNKHVIIELKRSGRVLDPDDVKAQISKYYAAVEAALAGTEHRDERIEFVCIVGQPLKNWENQKLEQRDREALQPYNAIIKTYSDLINSAQQTYSNYTEKEKSVSRVYDLIASVSEYDKKTMSQTEELDDND